MKNLSRCIAVTIITILFLQCGQNSVDSSNQPPRALSPGETQLVDSGNRFGFKLFKGIVQDQPDSNIFISPLSVSMALGMAYNGANGSTREAMDSTLEFNGLDIQQVNESYRSLIDLLINLDPVVVFQIANSIWYRLGFQVEPDFLDLNRTYFDAEVSELDFSDPIAADIINSWVDENTNGKITEIIQPPIDPLTVMFLINAIYFYGDWTYQFDEDSTYDAMFILPDGSQSPCRMMTQENNFKYIENNDFQAVDLPYGNGLFSMTIFLPRPQVGIDALIDNLNQENWISWINSFNEQQGIVHLPKFRFEWEDSLNNVLKALGMEIAFTGFADFTGIRRSGGIFISMVKHKTFIEVDEEGTEAAAVTIIEFRESVGLDFNIMFDRPFIFMIRENHSQTVLFMGKIVEPVWE